MTTKHGKPLPALMNRDCVTRLAANAGGSRFDASSERSTSSTRAGATAKARGSSEILTRHPFKDGGLPDLQDRGNGDWSSA
jgi:hypothetical protein